jgi:hypothetical protein
MHNILFKALLFLCLSMVCTITKGDGDPYSQIQAEAISPSLNAVMEEVKEYKNSNQVAMDCTTFLDLIKKNNELKIYEIGIVYSELIKSQEPIITKDQLEELYKSKMASISNFDCKYTITSKKKNEITFKEVRFATEGSKVFSETSEKNENTNFVSIRRHAFNGTIWRQLECVGGKFSGEISKDSKEGIVYSETDFLKNLHLRECPEGHNKLAMYHLIDFLEEPGTMIQEKLISKNGEKYLLITDGIRELLLDINKGFSIAEVNSYSYEDDICSREKVFERVFSDFVDCGNDIWLPQKITDNNLETGELSIVEVSDYMVNGTIDKKLFDEDIFPDGTVVCDVETGVFYVQGFPNVIERQIDDFLADRFFPPSSENDNHESEVLSKVPTSSIDRPDTTTRQEVTKGGNETTLKLVISVLMLIMVFCFVKMLAKRGKK